jgi:uncharacterized OsmC-like protein
MPTREISVSFAPDSKNIQIQIESFTVIADGGDRSEPSPGVLFISGVAACTASTARGYCHRNGLPYPTGLNAEVTFNDETHLVDSVNMRVLVPPEFPAERLDALQKAAGKCTVKKWWQSPPDFSVSASQEESS